MNKKETYRKNMRCLDKWITNLEHKKWIADYLNAFQIYRIAIYGYGMLGKHLVRELQRKNFSICWVMDKSSFGDDVYSKVVRPDDLNKCADVDMVIVTSVTAVEEVEILLRNYITGKILSIEELIDFIYTWGNQN